VQGFLVTESSGNFGTANFNTYANVMRRVEKPEDPWVSMGAVHWQEYFGGPDYMFWGEYAPLEKDSTHAAFKDANGGTIAFVR
jgi:hypothetical protein